MGRKKGLETRPKRGAPEIRIRPTESEIEVHGSIAGVRLDVKLAGDRPLLRSILGGLLGTQREEEQQD